MAKLTTAARKKIPTGEFAGPHRSYPIEDASHARNALARVSQHGSPALKSRVRAAVHRKYPDMGKEKSALGTLHSGSGHSSTHHAPVHVNVHLHMGGKKKFSL